MGLLLSLHSAAACGSDSDGRPGAASSSSGSGGAGGGAADPTLVVTDKGPVKGVIVGNTRAFLGIPYAAPPVGDLRWKSPVRAAAWTEPRAAAVRGPACPQLAPFTSVPLEGTSEDCLSLNIWTPASFNYPVPLEGTSEDCLSLNIWTPASFNYRLGPLGFLAHSALGAEDVAHPSAGMYGFEDQRLA